MKRQVKYRNFLSCRLLFPLKFVSLPYDLASVSIISSYIINESSIIPAKYFSLSQLQEAGLQTQSFSHIWCFLHSHRHLLLSHNWFNLHFVSSNLHFHSHEICFVNILGSIIPVIILNTLRFKSFVLFRTHILLDKSFTEALKLRTHWFNLTALKFLTVFIRMLINKGKLNLTFAIA